MGGSMARTRTVDDLRDDARTLLRAGETEQAIELFEEALELNLEEPNVHEEMALAYFMLGDLEQALAHFETATMLDPKRGTAFVNMGAVYNRLKRYDKAVEMLNKGIKCNLRSSEAYYNLGIAYRHLKEWNLAITAYKEAIRLEPHMAESYQNLGNVYLEMNNPQMAQQQYKKALEYRPGFERARRGLEKCETLISAEKRAENPFGRLMSEEALSRSITDSAIIRQKHLNEAQRQFDRQTVHELATLLKTAAAEMDHLLTGNLEPRLHALIKAVTVNKSVHAMSAAFAPFQETHGKFDERIKQLQEIVDRLLKHEESMRE